MFAENASAFLAMHLLSLTFPTVMCVSFGYGIVEMMVPVMGRIGSTVYPDMLIAGIVVFSVNSIFSYMVRIN